MFHSFEASFSCLGKAPPDMWQISSSSSSSSSSVAVVDNVHDVLMVVVMVVLISFTGKAMTGGNRGYLKCLLDLPSMGFGRHFFVGSRHMAGYFKF